MDRTQLLRDRFLWLFAANVVTLAAVALFPGAGQWLALSSSLPRLLEVPWTPLSYMITQFSVLHLLVNMLWLWLFWRFLKISGHGRMLLPSYIGGGLFGGFLFLAGMNLLPGYSGVPSLLCGASGAVLSVIGTTGLLHPDEECNLLLLGRVKLKWVAGVSILLIFIGSGSEDAGGGLAHAGGLLYGLSYGLWQRARQQQKSVEQGVRKHVKVRVMKRLHTAETQAALAKRRNDCQRLDELLDKISASGFESLSNQERNELNELSLRLKPQREINRNER